MPEYLSPGVYVEEIDSAPKPIEGVSTSTAAFVGFSEKAPEITKRRNGKYVTEKALGLPRLITNWTQYLDEFGGFVEGAYLPYAVYGFFQNGGQRCYVMSVQEVEKMPKAHRKLLNGQLIVEAKKRGVEGTRLRFKLELDQLPQAGSQPAAPATGPKPADSTKKTEPKSDSPAPKVASSAEASSFKMYVERLEDNGKWRLIDKLEDVTLVEEAAPAGGGKTTTRVKYRYDKGSDWVDILLPTAKPSLAPLQDEADWHYLEFEKAQLPAPDTTRLRGEENRRTGIVGLEALDDVSIVCVPDLMIPKPGQDKPDAAFVRDVQELIVAHCHQMGDRVVILDPPPDLSPQEVKEWRMRLPDSDYATLYYPWLEVVDPVQERTMYIPPSGHIAGVWARSDVDRGVHKAPANEPVRNITGLAYEVTKGEQDLLNPAGINCLRTFPGRGTRIWGARTLSSNPAWRYLNVRRLFNFVEKSIERDTQWVVFEPNDPDLWARVSRDVSSFLKVVWRSGALFGLTEEEAFYVKCDEELNPPESRDLGRLVIEIGMSPVKPAEFVIFRVLQTSGVATE